jgi:hypothetical protein
MVSKSHDETYASHGLTSVGPKDDIVFGRVAPTLEEVEEKMSSTDVDVTREGAIVEDLVRLCDQKTLGIPNGPVAEFASLDSNAMFREAGVRQRGELAL